jgi:NTF2-related export protein 1/2
MAGRRAEVETRASTEGKKLWEPHDVHTPWRSILRPLLACAAKGRFNNEVCIANQSCVVATNFADWYYTNLNKHRPLSDFYVTSNARYRDAGLRADVVINGLVLHDTGDVSAAPALAYEELLKKQRTVPATGRPDGRVHYEVDNVDVQVLNPDYTFACPEHVANSRLDSSGRTAAGAEPAMQLLVQIAGSITFGADKDAQKKGFSEIFVLVPNWDAFKKGAARNARRFLIQSQNFRSL